VLPPTLLQRLLLRPLQQLADAAKHAAAASASQHLPQPQLLAGVLVLLLPQPLSASSPPTAATSLLRCTC
jgi:ABC-type uncharacterized transport system permease subunit